jgi:two-component system invasion response regulator UvrY
MIKVLLVDDHELIRAGVKKILESSDDIRVVAESGSGEDALIKAKKFQPDVALMDIHMPGIGGIEATRKLHRACPSLKVIALTVLDEEPFPATLQEAGAVGYLTKGCPASEMFEAIRITCAGGVYIASAMARKYALAGLKKKPSSPFSELGSREMQVALMILDGQGNQAISDALCLSPKTVSTYRQRIYGKLGVTNDVELTRLAFRYGFLDELGR